MEKDLIFFGESGLTSTSANFIANLAKEKYSTLEQTLNNIRFYTTTVKLLGSSDESLVSSGVSSVAHVESYLKQIAKLKSLIAWLREAISAKDRLIKECQNGDYAYYGMQVPEQPEREESITADDVIATFNIKQRNRYYYLESYCSTIGKYIHPNGVFAMEREKLHNIKQNPHEVSGNGRDTIIYSRKASMPADMVDEEFMSLQQTYREYQAELNSIKHEIEDAVTKDAAKKNIAYDEKMSDYRNIMLSLSAQLATKRKESVTAASNLKIVIPDTLKDIYEDVKELGKD